MSVERTVVGLLIAFALVTGGDALAEPARGRGQGRTGLEVSLHGSRTALVGRPYRLRGVAYEVLGLATLRPLAGARVRARQVGVPSAHGPLASAPASADLVGPWAEVEAAAGGRFELVVEDPGVAREHAAIEVVVADGRDERTVRLRLELSTPIAVDLWADRNLYEPGERAHLWARVTDGRSLRPVAGERVRFVVSHRGKRWERILSTSRAGVATTTYPFPETAEEGVRYLMASIGEGRRRVELTRHLTVGRRTGERLFVTVEAPPEPVAPGGSVELRAFVRTPSGTPVPGAEVSFHVGDGAARVAETDRAGTVGVEVRAPAFLASSSHLVEVRASAVHPAHGSSEARTSFRLATPSALAVDVLTPRGGVLLDTDDEVWVAILDATGEPPPEGTPVEVTGRAVRGGRHGGSTDRHGLLTVPTRVSRGAVTDHGFVSGLPVRASTVRVTVGGERPALATLLVPVLEDVLVAPSVSRPVASPGEVVEVALRRRPEARRSAVVVDLVGRSGRFDDAVLATALAPPEARTVDLRLPEDALGILRVRARPVGVVLADEGRGAVDLLISRPSRPSFPELSVDREVHPVDGTARISVRTDPGSAESYLALSVRDLAAHGGEDEFVGLFLGGAFDRAVLDPTSGASERLVRAVLAAHATLDGGPERVERLVGPLGEPGSAGGPPSFGGRGELRDPVVLGLWLSRWGASRATRALEAELSRALGEGRVDDLVEGAGPSRRFREELLEELFARLPAAERPTTLGGGAITPNMLSESDPSFSFESVARRVARARLVGLLAVLSRALSEVDGSAPAIDPEVEPPERWLSILVRRGELSPDDLADPWGGTFRVAETGRRPSLPLAVEGVGLELFSPGPDGIPGSSDDVRDPFARVVPAGTPWAVASGEDRLMAELGTQSPASRALPAIVEAYRRTSRAAEAERTGDAAAASQSEDASGSLFGTIVGDSYGTGGLGLTGYGRGGGGFGSRRASIPSIRTGAATVGPQPRIRGILAGIVRDRFPATLLFRGEIPVDPSGATVVDVPLSQAVTTHLVEVVLWSSDGWRWSGSTRIRVEQDAVVDAPVPPAATVGDVLVLPVRIGNRTADPLRAAVRIEADGDLLAGPIVLPEVVVPPGDGVAVPVEVELGRSGEGSFTVVAVGRDGRPLDAIRRRISVFADGRRASLEATALADGRADLELHVPDGASARPGCEIRVLSGPAMVGPGGHDRVLWSGWAQALSGDPGDEAIGRAREAVAAWAALGDLSALGAAVGVVWRDPATPDRAVEEVLELFSRRVFSTVEDGRVAVDRVPLGPTAQDLLGLAPAVRRPEARPALRAALSELVAAQRRAVADGAARLSGSPTVAALAAAALVATAPPGREDRRAAELLRRARRGVVRVGDIAWVEADPTDDPLGFLRGTAALAVAEALSGRRASSFALLGALASSRGLGELRLEEETGAPHRAEDLAGAAALLLAAGSSPRSARLSIDGVERDLALEDGVATAPAPEVGSSGLHRVGLVVPAGALAFVTARAVFSVPWSVPPAEPGPLSMELSGDPGVRDETSELVLTVRSRVPRLLASPEVEVDLPAGAELDPASLEALERLVRERPVVSGRTLRLALRPLAAGREVRLPLRLRWTVGGRLRGLGLVGRSGDRPRAETVVPSRVVVVREPHVAATGGSVQ